MLSALYCLLQDSVSLVQKMDFTSLYKPTFWHRDYNAAMNILACYMAVAYGQKRLMHSIVVSIEVKPSALEAFKVYHLLHVWMDCWHELTFQTPCYRTGNSSLMFGTH